MGFFKKKDKNKANALKPEETADSDSKKKKGSDNQYKITIKERRGSGTKTIKTFDAERYLDQDDFVVYLYNKKSKFLELFPQQEQDFAEFNEEDLTSKLEELKQSLSDELHEDTEATNDNNLEFEIMTLEAKLRHIKYNNDDACYTTAGDDNKDEFIFLREGSTFHPYKWDSSTKTIYTPSDNKKKSAMMLLRNKEYKYSKFKDVIEGTTIFLLVLSFIFAAGGGWLYVKAYTMYDTSNIAESTRASLDVANQCAEIVLETAVETTKLAKESKGLVEALKDKIIVQETVITAPPIREVTQ